MRIAAIVINIILFILAVYLLLTQGFPTGYFLVWLIILLCPVVNLIALLAGGKEGDHFLSMYFKRRCLEEKKRIEALEKGE